MKIQEKERERERCVSESDYGRVDNGRRVPEKKVFWWMSFIIMCSLS